MKILFFDDDAQRHDLFLASLQQPRSDAETYHAYSIRQAWGILDANRLEPFDYAFLDHDMGPMFETDPWKTGEAVARFIAGLVPSERPRKIVLHSFNPDGARRMAVTLRPDYCTNGVGPKTIIAPFDGETFRSILDGMQVLARTKGGGE